MLWVKALHIISVVTWFAGLFYLPRLFVYHALTNDQLGQDRFKVMERKLFFGIMTPGAIMAVASGLWLWLDYGFSGGWLHAKFFLVAILIAYHVYCGRVLHSFRHNHNSHSDVFYRWLNEIPVILLIGIVLLATIKPF
jgi:putative membrane protein